MDIDVRSEGCNDPTKTPNTCGVAYIRVNGKNYSPRIRGHNVVVLDDATGNKRFAVDLFLICEPQSTHWTYNCSDPYCFLIGCCIAW